MLFHRRGFCGLARLFVTFGGSGGMMTTARTELPYPCSPKAKTRGESSRRGKSCNGIVSLVEYVGATY